MRKLKLDLDSLDVQSFATDKETPASGTVQGHITGEVCPPRTDWDTCGTCETWDQYTCWETCYASCRTCYDETCEGTC